eukprot:3530587-Karenia_brevis.AAC.1
MSINWDRTLNGAKPSGPFMGARATRRWRTGGLLSTKKRIKQNLLGNCGDDDDDDDDDDDGGD